MDFNYSPEDEAFRAEFRAWLEKNRQYAIPAREPLADEADDDWERAHPMASQAQRGRLDRA